MCAMKLEKRNKLMIILNLIIFVYYSTRHNIKFILPEIPSLLYPRCKHATLASRLFHVSSQTVPHWLLLQTSTLPWLDDDPLPASRMAPLVQPLMYRDWSNANYLNILVLTCISCHTSDCHIIFMATVVISVKHAVNDSICIARTHHIVSYNRTISTAKEISSNKWSCTCMICIN